jgi:Protein of unknown function (DUF3079)
VQLADTGKKIENEIVFRGIATNSTTADIGSTEITPNAPLHPKHPERICWGCGIYCPAKGLACREDRVLHPIETFGYDSESTSQLELPRSIGLL